MKTLNNSTFQHENDDVVVINPEEDSNLLIMWAGIGSAIGLLILLTVVIAVGRKHTKLQLISNRRFPGSRSQVLFEELDWDFSNSTKVVPNPSKLFWNDTSDTVVDDNGVERFDSQINWHQNPIYINSSAGTQTLQLSSQTIQPRQEYKDGKNIDGIALNDEVTYQLVGDQKEDEDTYELACHLGIDQEDESLYDFALNKPNERKLGKSNGIYSYAVNQSFTTQQNIDTVYHIGGLGVTGVTEELYSTCDSEQQELYMDTYELPCTYELAVRFPSNESKDQKTTSPCVNQHGANFMSSNVKEQLISHLPAERAVVGSGDEYAESYCQESELDYCTSEFVPDIRSNEW